MTKDQEAENIDAQNKPVIVSRKHLNLSNAQGEMEQGRSSSAHHQTSAGLLNATQSNDVAEHSETTVKNGSNSAQEQASQSHKTPNGAQSHLSATNSRYTMSEPGNRPPSVSPGRSTMSNISNEKMRQKVFKEKYAKYSGSQEDFDYETRFVVLNFMGFVPLSSLSASQRTSSDESGDRRSHVQSQVSVDSSKSGAARHRKGESGEWGGLPSLPELSITEKFHDRHGKVVKEGDLVVSATKRKSPPHRKSPRKSLQGDDVPMSGKGIQFGAGWPEEEQEEEMCELRENVEKLVNVEVEEDSASDSLPEPTTWLAHSASDPALLRRDVLRRADDLAPQDRKDAATTDGRDEVDAKPWSDASVQRPTTIDIHKPITPPSYTIDPSLPAPPLPPPAAQPSPSPPPPPATSGSHSTSQPTTPSPPSKAGNVGQADTHPYGSYTRVSPHRRKAYTMDSQRGLRDAAWGRETLKWQQSTASQGSDHSSISEIESLMQSARSHSSTRSDVVDVTSMDVSVVTPLVESKALPSMVLDLKVELDEQFQEMELQSQYSARSMSPESQVAAYLSHLGDKVQEEYGSILETALGSVTCQRREDVDYDQFSAVAGEVTQGTTGVTKVALLLLFGKQVAHSLVSRGDRGIGHVVEYTTRLIEDQAADFIIDKGGWNSIKEIEEEEHWNPFDVTDVEPGITPDSLNQEAPEISQEEQDIVTSLPHPSSSVMTESFHSDTTDTTVIANIKGRDPSIETISSLATGASDDSLNARLSDSPRDSPKDGPPRIRHGSGPRRGSFTIVPYPDHIDPSLVSTSESKLHREGSGENSNNNMNANYNMFGEFNLQASFSCTTTCMEAQQEDTNDFSCTDNHALIEGTMDPSIADDVMFMRQISKELAEEGERDRERVNRCHHLKIVVAIGVVLVAVVYLWRKGKK